VSIVLGQNFAKQLMLRMVDSLDDVFVVARKVEEATTLAWGAQLRQNVLAGKGHQVIGGIEAEFRTEMAEYPGGIVFELEVVLC